METYPLRRDIPVEEGYVRLGAKPGLGTRLQDDFTSRPGAHVEVTTEEQLNSW